ncbi:MAG: hypothetical protein AAFQ41_07770 [Cyanobacteria bacterium J06623_7]
MLNLSCSSKNHDFPSGAEKLTDSGALGNYSVDANRLPRHISALETTPHRPNSRPHLTASLRQSSSRVTEAEASNLAVNILTYQLKDREAQQQHLANLHSNLQHRFEVAKAAQNTQLMALLQEEFRQLT